MSPGNVPVLPVELLDSIAAQIPISSRRLTCLSLVQVSRVWRVSAQRALFRDLAIYKQTQVESLHGLLFDPEFAGTRALERFAPCTRRAYFNFQYGTANMPQPVIMPLDSKYLELLSSFVGLVDLSIDLPVNQLEMDDEHIDVICSLKKLTTIRVEEGSITTRQFLRLIQELPKLHELHFTVNTPPTGLQQTTLTPTSSLVNCLLNTSIRVNRPEAYLYTLHLTKCSTLVDKDLLSIVEPCQHHLRHLQVEETLRITRRTMLVVLELVGGGLQSLSLRNCTFALQAGDLLPDGTIHDLSAFFDRIVIISPFLQELELTSDGVCSSDLVDKALKHLPLATFKINFALPRLEPSAVAASIRSLPMGRLETLELGPRTVGPWPSLEAVKRACMEVCTVLDIGRA